MKIEVMHKGKEKGELKGLINMGNTCYLNAVLQGLGSCKSLSEVLSNSKVAEKKPSPITTQLLEVCDYLKGREDEDDFCPSRLHRTIRKWDQCSNWTVKKQQDAGELLQILIAKLEKENPDAGALFKGLQQSWTRCNICKKLSGKDEPFTLMSLELDEKWEYPSNSTVNSLENLMEINEAKEDLRGVNKAFCQNCGTNTDAEKNLTWTVGPQILVMQLKRYKKKRETQLLE